MAENNSSCTCLTGWIQPHCSLTCEHAQHLIARAALRVCNRRGFPEHAGEVFLRVSFANSVRPEGLRLDVLEAYCASKLRDVLNGTHEAWGQNRRAGRFVNVSDVDIPDEPPDDEAPSELVEHLQRLPPHQREVLTLRYLTGLGPREIAARLGKSEAWVRRTLSDGLDALRRSLK